MTPIEKVMRAQRYIVDEDEATHRAIRAIENRLFWVAVKAVVVGYSIVGATGVLARIIALWLMRR